MPPACRGQPQTRSSPAGIADAGVREDGAGGGPRRCARSMSRRASSRRTASARARLIENHGRFASFSSTASIRSKPPFAPPRRRTAWSCPAARLFRSASSASASSARRDPRTRASVDGSGTSDEPLGRFDLAELAFDDAVGGAEAVAPPGRTSISSTTVPSPHHSGISSGSVQTEKTCGRGASKTRSTRISSSFGVVTVVSFTVSSRPASRASRSWPRRPSSASSTRRRRATSHRRRGSRCR